MTNRQMTGITVKRLPIRLANFHKLSINNLRTRNKIKEQYRLKA